MQVSVGVVSLMLWTDYCTGLRVEWAKTRARAERWREEVQLLDEEMRRTLEFGWWRARWWKQHADSHAGMPGHVGEGLRAYAIEQSNAERQRSVQWATKWSAVRGRA